MAKEKLFWIGVKALIENEAGKVLLLRADTSDHTKNTEQYWDIPGGRIQEGQNIQQALKREIKEEIGVKRIHSHRFFTAVISHHEIPFEDRILGLSLMIYKVKIPAASEIILSAEHVAHEWVDKVEAAKRLSNKYPAEFTSMMAAS